jgi:hypothetical protein
MDFMDFINTLNVGNLIAVTIIALVVLAAIVIAIKVLLNTLRKSKISIKKNKEGFEIDPGSSDNHDSEEEHHHNDEVKQSKVELMILIKKVVELVHEKDRIELKDIIREEMVLGSKAVELIVDSIKKVYLGLLKKYYPTSGLITENKYKYFSAILGLLSYRLLDELRRTAQENGLNKMNDADFSSYEETRCKTFKKLITDEIDLYYCWDQPNRVELYDESEKDWNTVRQTILVWLRDCRRISTEKNQAIESLNVVIEDSIYSFFMGPTVKNDKEKKDD